MKKVEISLASHSVWSTIVGEFFFDTHALIHYSKSPQECNFNTDLILIESTQMSLSLLQKLKVQRQVNPLFRIFALGELAENHRMIFDAVLTEPGNLSAFARVVTGELPMPEAIRLLIADDDPDILDMVCDYFAGRNVPQFDITRAINGVQALELIQKKRPDIIILDIKMPLMTGSEVYCKLQKQKEKIPTIIFFDAISAEDLKVIKKVGNPIIVEKGYRESSMPYLMALVKKLAYFSSASFVV